MLCGGAWARPSPAPLRFCPGVRLSKTQLSLMTALSAEHSAAPPVPTPVTPRCAPATGSADGCSQPRRVRDASAPAASFAATGVCWPRATSGPRRGRRAADVCGHKNVALKCPTSGTSRARAAGRSQTSDSLRAPTSASACRLSEAASCPRTSGGVARGRDTCSAPQACWVQLRRNRTHATWRDGLDLGPSGRDAGRPTLGPSPTKSQPREAPQRLVCPGHLVLSEGLAPWAGVSVDTCRWHPRAPRCPLAGAMPESAEGRR